MAAGFCVGFLVYFQHVFSDVDAFNCYVGCMNGIRKSALKADPGSKIPLVHSGK